MSKTCNLCKITPKYWEGDDRLCAFQEDSFSINNWNCATLGKLRKLILEHFDGKNPLDLDLVFRDDEERWVVIDLESVKLTVYDYESNDPIPEDPTCLYIGWYKSRGKTSQLLLMYNDQPPRAPTEAETLKIIKYLEEN